MATVLSPPQHCSQPGTSHTTQIFSQSGLLPHSLNAEQADWHTGEGATCLIRLPALQRQTESGRL